MAKNVLNERLSKEQLILNEIYKKKVDEPTIIDELKKNLEVPRTTLTLHLNALEEAGLIRKEKSDKTIQYFQIPEISQKMRDALERLQSAYAFALTFVTQKRLKELEDIKKK